MSCFKVWITRVTSLIRSLSRISAQIIRFQTWHSRFSAHYGEMRTLSKFDQDWQASSKLMFSTMFCQKRKLLCRGLTLNRIVWTQLDLFLQKFWLTVFHTEGSKITWSSNIFWKEVTIAKPLRERSHVPNGLQPTSDSTVYGNSEPKRIWYHTT